VNDIKIDEYPYALRHAGVIGCGKAACYLKCKPKFCSVIEYSIFINVDGTQIERLKPLVCGSCGGMGVLFNTPNIFNREEDRRRAYFNKHRIKGLEDWSWDYEK